MMHSYLKAVDAAEQCTHTYLYIHKDQQTSTQKYIFMYLGNTHQQHVIARWNLHAYIHTYTHTYTQTNTQKDRRIFPSHLSSFTYLRIRPHTMMKGHQKQAGMHLVYMMMQFDRHAVRIKPHEAFILTSTNHFDVLCMGL